MQGTLRDKRVSQAEFGRLVGLSRQRINRLVKCGMLETDSGGVKLFRALESFIRYSIDRRRRVFS